MEGQMTRRRKIEGEGGFSLLETVVAMGILAVGLLGMATLQLIAIRGNGAAMKRTEAVAFCEDQIEAFNITPWDDIAEGTTTETESGMTRTTTVEDDTPLNDIKRITVVVSWTDVTSHSVRFRTLLTKNS